MSADTWRDCPKCGGKETVRIDCIWDFDLIAEGKILNGARGFCTNCKQEFK